MKALIKGYKVQLSLIFSTLMLFFLGIKKVDATTFQACNTDNRIIYVLTLRLDGQLERLHRSSLNPGQCMNGAADYVNFHIEDGGILIDVGRSTDYFKARPVQICTLIVPESSSNWEQFISQQRFQYLSK